MEEEVTHLREENEFLKRLRALTEEYQKKERFLLIAKATTKSKKQSLTRLFRLADVSRSGFYCHLAQSTDLSNDENVVVKEYWGRPYVLLPSCRLLDKDFFFFELKF